MDRVRAWSGQEEAQTSATAEAEVTTLKRRLANCEEALKLEVASLTEAEKGQVELRKALVEKEAELVAAHREVAEERRRGADTDYLREKLRTVEADIRSLQHRHGILRSDLEEARSKEKQMEKAFDGMKTDMDKLRK
jgi:chromosome segregation ATPase